MDAQSAGLDIDDPQLEEKLVAELKSQGIFDQIRRDCLADVDTTVSSNNWTFYSICRSSGHNAIIFSIASVVLLYREGNIEGLSAFLRNFKLFVYCLCVLTRLFLHLCCCNSYWRYWPRTNPVLIRIGCVKIKDLDPFWSVFIIQSPHSESKMIDFRTDLSCGFISVKQKK